MDENHNGIDAFVPPKSDVQLPDVKTVTDVLKTRDWLHGQSYDLDVALTAGMLVHRERERERERELASEFCQTQTQSQMHLDI